MDTSTQTETSPAPQRAPLNRQRVLDAALTLLDRDGLDRLSMRRLAADLDVEAMSLYKYVDSKDDLLAGLTDLLWAEIAAAAPANDDWPTWLRAFGHAVRDTVLVHPNAMPVLVAGDVCPVSALELFTDQLDHVDGSSARRDAAVNATRAVAAYALGCVVSELSCFGPAPVNQAETERQQLLRISRALPPGTPERIIDTALVVCGDCDADRLFNDGLELIVRGCQVDK